MPVRSPLVDAYLARLPAAPRQALEKIRTAVHAAAPGCEECLYYGMPAVRLHGEPLVGWRAAAKHGAFHPLSGSTVAACAEPLAAYETSKGTIRFPFDAPLPLALVKRLVAARIQELSRAAPVKRAAPAKRVSPKRTAVKRAAPKPAAAARPTTKRTTRKPTVSKSAVGTRPAMRSGGSSGRRAP